MQIWSSICLGLNLQTARGKPMILHQSLQVQKADFLFKGVNAVATSKK